MAGSAALLVRTRVAEISQVGSNTQGVTLIRLPEDEKLAGVVKIESEDDEAPANGTGESGFSADDAADWGHFVGWGEPGFIGGTPTRFAESLGFA